MSSKQRPLGVIYVGRNRTDVPVGGSQNLPRNDPERSSWLMYSIVPRLGLSSTFLFIFQLVRRPVAKNVAVAVADDLHYDHVLALNLDH